MENRVRVDESEKERVDEKEEGELDEEELDIATKSPLPCTTQTVARSGSIPSSGSAAAGSLAGGSDGLPVHPVTSASDRRASTPGQGGALPSRAPPTAPRAMRRQSSTVPSTPRAPRNAGPATAPRAAGQSSAGDQRVGQRRPASPHNDTRAFKRQRADAPMQVIVPDPRNVEIASLQERLRQKDQIIQDLEWKLVEMQAKLHIYKTRGAAHDFDVELQDRITKKIWKRTYPERCEHNWRIDELSELSDEEPTRAPPTRVPSNVSSRSARREQNDMSATIVTDSGKPPRADSIQSPLGEIFTLYGDVDETQDAACAFDEEEDGGHAAATVDLAAGAADASRRALNTARRARDVSSSEAAKQLSREELLAKMALVQYGLRFSYTLSLLQENGRWLPAPLGRFGQPFWKGSSWEDFDPRRLFEKERPDYVALQTKQFLQLAQDAARIAFVYRSASQRQVVSIALQHQLVVNAHEPDMITLCRTNPSRIPIAIRRHYRRNTKNTIFYTEFDAADISNYIVLSLSGPQKMQDGLPRRDYHEQKRAWLQQVDVFVLDWLPLFSHLLKDPEPEQFAQDVAAWPVDIDLVPGRTKDDVIFTEMWKHLTTNGLSRRSLLPGGDCHDYVRRGRAMEQERRRLASVYKERVGQDQVSNQDAERRWIGDRLPYEPVPAGLPVLRVRMSREKELALAMKYRVRGNEKGFIPL